jgi:hypothetical protein
MQNLADQPAPHPYPLDFLKSFFHLVKKVMLRGRLLRWWIRKRADQLDVAYLKAQASMPELGRASAPAIVRPRSILERVVFIGDCMWEHEQLFPEIRKICELKVLDLRTHLNTASDPALAVADAIRSFLGANSGYEPDLAIIYLRPSLLSEEVFSEIRSKWTCPLFGLNLDDRVEFFPYGILSGGNDDYARWILSFDLNLTSSLAAVEWYRARGATAMYLPQGFHPNPNFASPPQLSEIQIPFSFVGSWKPERGVIVDQLTRHGFPPRIYGRGWKESKWAEDAATIFRHSQINLGVGYATASAKIANAKGRDVECPGTGACYLTTYHWELAEMFEIGKEVLCYRNLEELVEMLSFYLNRPDLCLQVARAAHRRSRAEHTWEIRLRKLFRDYGFQVVSKS